MIVLLASFPRSGNTYFRILLHHMYAVPTYTGLFSGDDLEFDADAGYLTGHRPLPVELVAAQRSGDSARVRLMLDQLESAEEVYFIATRNTWTELQCPAYRTILIFRDGRDTLVSFAWYRRTVAESFRRLRGALKHYFEWKLKRIFRILKIAFAASKNAILRLFGLEQLLFRRTLQTEIEDTRWSTFHHNWLGKTDGKTVLVRFEDLIKAPGETLASALDALNLPYVCAAPREIPRFEALKSIHPWFFRKGMSGGWRHEFPAEWLERFWQVHGEAMQRLGYGKEE